MENIQWLLENGGPAMKLNLINEGLIDKDSYNIEKLVDELLQIEKVKTALTYFDKFNNYKSVTIKQLNANLHNCYEDCYERFMPFLINLGFRKGISILDEKIGIMQEVYQYLATQEYGSWEIVVMLMLEAGYYNKDMLDYLTIKFLDKIYKTAEQQCFDIYETDPSKIRWSKLPEIWKDKPICKDIHVHDCDASELPLPTIYHIKPIIYIYKYVEDNAIKNKIETVIKYILHPEYQKLRGFYGYSWFYNKAYYAPSPGVALPFYEDKEIHAGDRGVLEMMSLVPFVTKTDWFKNCVDFLEQYKTERGTYILSDGGLRPANTTTISAYISKDVKIKRNDKQSFLAELLSTYFVELMKNRMKI